MAAVKSDRSVVTWGTADDGGDSVAVKASLVNVVRVFGSSHAFAALTSSGTVVAWGIPAVEVLFPATRLLR
jgi:hypothetical protein